MSPFTPRVVVKTAYYNICLAEFGIFITVVLMLSVTSINSPGNLVYSSHNTQRASESGSKCGSLVVLPFVPRAAWRASSAAMPNTLTYDLPLTRQSSAVTDSLPSR